MPRTDRRIAVKGGAIHLGLRAPATTARRSSSARRSVSHFPGSGAFNPTVKSLSLGPDVGIRDLAVISNGLHILGGRAKALPGRATLFHLNDTTGVLKTLGVFLLPVDKREPEGLLVLDKQPEFMRVLVMFDGETNGAPLEYFIPQ